MKNLLVLLAFIGSGFFNYSAAQSFKEQFGKLVAEKDTTAQLTLLTEWEKAEPDNAELYVAWYNYYVERSRSSMIGLGAVPKGDDYLILSNTDTSVKEPAGYMYDDTYYEPTDMGNGFKYIDKGIKKFPDRLDLWFGKIYMLGEIEDYEYFTTEIIRVVNYSGVNKNKWLWTDDKPLDNPKVFMLDAIQSYVMQLYDTGDDSLLNNMKSIAESVLKLYPDHVESLSNISIVYTLFGKYDKALEVLLKAEKIAPTDFVVLNNIAYAYKLKGENKKAIKYYESTIKYGDEDAKKYAQEQLDELNGK